MTDASSSSRPRSFYGSLLWSIVWDALFPYLVYRLVSPHTSQAAALCWTMLPPAISNVVTFLRRRHLDIIGVIVIAGTAAGLLLFLFGGSPRLLLIRESFITGIIGLLFLISMLFPRPFSYYIARQFITNNDPVRIANWDRQYQQSRYKFGMPMITAVWGSVLVGEAVLRTVLAWTLSIARFLEVYNILFIGIYAVAMAWSSSYGWRMYRLEKFSVERQLPVSELAQAD